MAYTDSRLDEIGIFDGRNYRHREVSYAPRDLRLRRQKLYILTDRPDRVAPDFASECDGLLNDLCTLNDHQIRDGAFYIWFSRAALALPLLRRIVDCGGLFAPPPMFGKANFFQVSAKGLDSYNEAGRRLGHTPFMDWPVHAQICQAVEMTRDLLGDFVEIGVYSGSSALTALTHMRNLGVRRRCWLLDTYVGFQYAAAITSSDMIWSNTHLMTKGPEMTRITELMRETEQDVHVLSNEICKDALPKEITQIALANVDVDMYEAVLSALQKLGPLMTRRGVIIVEDPTSVPGLYGAYLALDEFSRTSIGRDFVSVRFDTQYFLIRVQ